MNCINVSVSMRTAMQNTVLQISQFFSCSCSNTNTVTLSPKLDIAHFIRITKHTQIQNENNSIFFCFQDYLRTCMAQMEAIFEQQLKQQRLLPSYLINITAQNITSNNVLEVPQLTPEKNTKSLAGTPTDVQDVKF